MTHAYLIERVWLRLNSYSGEIFKETTGTSEVKHAADYRELVGNRLADTTAAVRVNIAGPSAPMAERPFWNYSCRTEIHV